MTNEPLGLPKGSIRAILVLLIVVFAGIGLLLSNQDAANRCFDILKVIIPGYIFGRMSWDKSTEGDKE